MGDEALLGVGGSLSLLLLELGTEVKRGMQQQRVKVGLLVGCAHILAVLTRRKL